MVAPKAVPAGSLPCSARTGVALPDGWPSAVPLPSGLVVTRTERRSGGRLIAYGRVRGDFHAVVRSFNSRLPAAGFAQKMGEIDPHDAESDFIGRTVRGRWTAGLSPECEGQSSVTVLCCLRAPRVGLTTDRCAGPSRSRCCRGARPAVVGGAVAMVAGGVTVLVPPAGAFATSPACRHTVGGSAQDRAVVRSVSGA